MNEVLPRIQRRLLVAAHGDLIQIKQFKQLVAAASRDGAYLSLKNSGGILSALHMASKAHQFAIVRFLLDEYGRAIVRNDGVADAAAVSESNATTLLLFAVSSNHVTMAQYLVKECGAQINQSIGNQDGWTPLHHASMHGHLPMVKYLVEQGGTSAIELTDTCGWTALHSACLYNRLEIVEYLLGHCPACNPSCTRRVIEARTNQQLTPLLVAAGSLCVDTVSFLIVHGGATVMATDHLGRSAIHLATASKCRNRVLSTVWCLVQYLPVDHGLSQGIR